MKILLALENANPDNLDLGGRRPLSYAADNEHMEVVKVLIERTDVNLNHLG